MGTDALASPFVRVSVEGVEDQKDPKNEKVVDEDLRKFNAWMSERLNGELLPIERSAIKTYLAWKLGRIV